ncbi:DUF742 domain-containing protein [Spirillospora sp. CA-294931]|uniref:DUF742 domain-containing protein n=1 Tax=Spirillospora sp. CA-294931 TaxID=3240042 RepID=UPI003D8A752D
MRPYLTANDSCDPDYGVFEPLTMIVAAVSESEIRGEVKVFPTHRDGVTYDSEYAFGLGPEHLTLLRLCQRPRAVVDLAEHLGRQSGPIPSFAADHLEIRSVAEIMGPSCLPFGTVRVLLGDLSVKGLIYAEPPVPARHLDQRAYLAMLSGIQAL